MRRPIFASLALLSTLLVGCGAVAEDSSRHDVDSVNIGIDAGVADGPRAQPGAPGLTGSTNAPPPAAGPAGSGAPMPATPGATAVDGQPTAVVIDPGATPVAPSPTSPATPPTTAPSGSAGLGSGGSATQGGNAGAEPEDESGSGGTAPTPVQNGGAAGNSAGGSSAGGNGAGGGDNTNGGAGGSGTISLPSAFNIELVFDDVDTIDASVLDAFRVAEQRWEAVIIGDLPDVAASVAGDCNGHAVPNGVDDVVIFVSVVPFDGPQGLLGAAGPCAIRSTGTRLPFAGAMEFDEDDLQSFAEIGRLDEIVLHEMGHVLGIGSMWEALSLLDNPSDGSDMADTAFNGSQARIAFDSVGGVNYEGNKVPVENSGGEGEINGHWRESALGSELMTTKMGSSPAQLSVVTIASLQDLGYTVSFDVADTYSWPSVDEALSFQTTRQPTASAIIDLSHDHLVLPLYEVSEEGVTRRLTPNGP